MKKLLLATALAVASMSSFAVTPNADTKQNQEIKALEKAESAYKNGNYAQAFKEFESQAKLNNPQALYNLGVMYEQGQGAKKSDKKAIESFKKSASQGFAAANFALGKAYLTGSHGLSKNEQLAKNHLTLASNSGMEIATVGLSEVLLSENNEASTKLALNLLAPLVKKGHLDATYLRALYDLKSGKETKNFKSIETGIKALESSSMKGHIPSLMVLGNFNATGTFVKKDLQKAKEIFTVLDKAQIPVAKKLLEEVNKEIVEKK